MLIDLQSMTTRLLFFPSNILSHQALTVVLASHICQQNITTQQVWSKTSTLTCYTCKTDYKHSLFCTPLCPKALIYSSLVCHIHTHMAGIPTWQPKEHGLCRKWPGYTSELKHQHEMHVACSVTRNIKKTTLQNRKR